MVVAFLLAAMNHFLADERDKATAQKRGGGVPAVTLDGRPANLLIAHPE